MCVTKVYLLLCDYLRGSICVYKIIQCYTIVAVVYICYECLGVVGVFCKQSYLLIGVNIGVVPVVYCMQILYDFNRVP